MASFAMQAILCIDLQFFASVVVINKLVDLGWAEPQLRLAYLSSGAPYSCRLSMGLSDLLGFMRRWVG
jgi:hypothetical protein